MGLWSNKRGGAVVGQRVKKEIYTGSSLTGTDYYVRDAAGTVLAVYNGSTVKEHTIYGGSRLGVYYRTGSTSVYQLTDHLGNVRALVGKVAGNAVINGATDYYPFGMIMPNRSLSGAEGYRYAYQGQEKDPETGKEAFELRLWDGRIGRWLTTDPAGQYSSPYLGMGNNPINRVDPDGGFDTWIGAWLYKTFNGTGGKLIETDYGWAINLSDGSYEQGVNLITGHKWERNLNGTFKLFDKNDVSFAQFGADPAIATVMSSNLMLTISKKINTKKVLSQDYLFRVAANSKSADPRIDRSNGTLSVDIKLSYADNTSEIKNLRYKEPGTGNSRHTISDYGMLSGESSFRITNYNNGVNIRLHRLSWLYQGDEPGLHLGTKGGVIPAGIDPIFGGTTFGGRITIFGE